MDAMNSRSVESFYDGLASEYHLISETGGLLPNGKATLSPHSWLPKGSTHAPKCGRQR